MRRGFLIIFAYFAYFAVENFLWQRSVADDGADTAPLQPMMPPRRGWGIFWFGFLQRWRAYGAGKIQISR
jgi:hypothetical protein